MSPQPLPCRPPEASSSLLPPFPAFVPFHPPPRYTPAKGPCGLACLRKGSVRSSVCRSTRGEPCPYLQKPRGSLACYQPSKPYTASEIRAPRSISFEVAAARRLRCLGWHKIPAASSTRLRFRAATPSATTSLIVLATRSSLAIVYRVRAASSAPKRDAATAVVSACLHGRRHGEYVK